MNGIILVNKEKKMTSHDVVNQIRKIFKTKQVGHLGTLDPLATGLLAICINNSTKLVQFLSDHNKTYVARVCLGISTDTYDLEGNITEKKEVEYLNETIIDQCLESFLGESVQIPPIYSSIKVNGKKLYEYARNNQNVEIPKRKITIFDIKRISKLEYLNQCCYFDISVSVSKGTYIRSLCYDIGQKLNYPSMMVDLKRIKLGDFSIDDASTLDEIKNQHFKIFSNLEALQMYKCIDDLNLINKAKNGMKIKIDDIKNITDSLDNYVVIKENEELIAIYQLDLEKKCYKAARVWN